MPEDKWLPDRHWRGAGLSLLLPAGALRVLGLLLLVLALLSLLAMALGPLWINPLDLQAPSPLQQLVLFELRWPRLLLGLIVGASLAVAGFVLQSLTRVSIAAPSVLGLADGAGLSVVLVLFAGEALWGGKLLSPQGMALAALAGAVAVLMLLRGLSRRDGDLEKMVFAGLVVAAICKALVSLLLLLSQSDMAMQAQIWLVGSLAQANPALNRWLLAACVLLLVMTLLNYRSLALYRLSDEVMGSLGQPVGISQRWLYLLAAGLTAIAVAGAGQISFVGLVVPHLIRRICPRGVPAQLVGNACGGALLVVAADVLARNLFAPYELPVGIFTALIGVPCFLWLYGRGGRS
jgi:iron complex transport system permease protein